MKKASSSTQTYSTLNQIYSLKEITNAAFGLTSPQPNAFANLQNYVTQVIQTTLTTDQGSVGPNDGNYLGSTAENTEWTIGWGPVIYSFNSDAPEVVTDNVMAVYYNASHNAYVISIAGTNAVSTYDWMDEDFAVYSMVPWTNFSKPPAGVTPPSPPAYISQGAATGFNVLLNIMTSNGQSLVDYLTSIDTTPGATLYVTGHSLGASLATLMGLYLVEQGSTWNASGVFSAVSVLPTASATPGDSVFAAYFNQIATTPPEGAITSFSYSHIFNQIDAVPNAWYMPESAPALPPVAAPDVYIPCMANLPFLYNNFPLNPPTATTPPDSIISSLVIASVGVSGAMSFLNPDIPTMSYTPVALGTTGNVSSNSFIAQYVPTSTAIGTIPLLNELSNFFNLLLPIACFDYSSWPAFANPQYVENLIDFGNYLIQIMYQHGTPYFENAFIQTSAFMNEFYAIQATIPNPGVTGSMTPAGVQEQIARKVIKKHFGNLDLTNLKAAIQNKKAMELAGQTS